MDLSLVQVILLAIAVATGFVAIASLIFKSIVWAWKRLNRRTSGHGRNLSGELDA